LSTRVCAVGGGLTHDTGRLVGYNGGVWSPRSDRRERRLRPSGRRRLPRLALLAPALALAAAFAGAHAEPASAWQGDAATVRAGLARAVSAGRLAEIEAHEYRLDLAAAARVVMARGGGSPVAASLRDVASHASRYDSPRALTLFRTLRLNTQLYGSGRGPSRRTVKDDDGVAYRKVASGGVRFHPLASFGNLNREAADRNYPATIRLAYALLARAHVKRDELVWEYQFAYGGGAAPWGSGLAQAVAAQALARAGFVNEARQAYRPIPRRLLLRLPEGPWVRLYSFSGMAVLNAQLQAAVSIAEYGRIARDPGAQELARELREAAAALLPRFDTGSWSLYALRGSESTLEYHTYVTSLLWKLSRRTGEERWVAWAARLRDQWRTPPYMTAHPPSRAAIPLPEDGFRDWAEIRFHLSKPARVELTVAGETLGRRLQAGDRSIWWRPGPRAPGTYDVRIRAVDRVGNVSERSLPPVTIERDNEPPELVTTLEGRTLRWQARDAGTPWLTLRVLVQRGGAVQERVLTRAALEGMHILDYDEQQLWHVTVVASDSAGNRTRLRLGHVGLSSRIPAGARSARRFS
jgi:hypothetical protein